MQSNAVYAVWGSVADTSLPMFVRSYKTGPSSYRNETTAFHAFNGSVERAFRQTSDGSIWVKTTGYGRSAMKFQDDLNDRWGPGIFKEQNAVCGKYLRAP